MNVRILTRTDVRNLMDLDLLVRQLSDGFAALSEGRIVAPDRSQIAVPGGGLLLVKPAWMPGVPIIVKLASTFYGNRAAGLPVIQALVTLFDEKTGAPLAIMDGAYLTAARTAAAAALSTKLMARDDARVLAIIGAGEQGRAHLEALPRVRDLREIRIASLRTEDARALAAADTRCRVCESCREAVQGADVVCLCTSADAPVIEVGWVKPGAHVTSVGYHPPGGELPAELARMGTLAVETRCAFAPPPVGCAELAGLDATAAAELGELVAGKRPGRRSAGEITVFKSSGHAMEDLVAADLVYRQALRGGAGACVEF